jgi:uncharacterized protein YggE
MLKTTLGSLALASALFACSPPGPLIAMTAPSTGEAVRPGQMTVTGTATLEVSPDCADLTMTITADGARPGLATKGVKDKQQALIAGLAKIGIESSDIKLSYLDLHPVYAPNPEGWSTLKVATYRSSVTVTVTTKKFDLIGDIMEAGASSGGTTMSSQFRRSDMPELKKKVRDMALDAAKAKAAQTAKSLGIELGRVVTVVEAPAGQMWRTAYFPNNSNAMETTGAGPTVAIGGALQPLTLDITIGFELASEV